MGVPMDVVTLNSPIPVGRTSTDDCKPKDRLDYWRDRISDYHDVSLPAGSQPEDFQINNTLWNLGGIVIVDARFSAHSQVRNPQKIRRGGADHYELVLPLTGGKSTFASDELQREIGSGDLLMKDLGQTEQAGICNSRQIVTFVGRDFLDRHLRSAPNAHGLLLQGPLAALLADHLRNLVACLPSASATAAPVLAEATAALVAAAVTGTPAAMEAARPQIHDTLRRRIIAHIDLHLEDAQLSQDYLCRTFHLSRPSLYRLFSPLGGVASVIQTRRLARIRQILATAGELHHLGVLSERFAFSSQSQMSRAFRSLYGHAPTETETSAWAREGSTSTTHAPTFLQWMQELGRSMPRIS